MQRLALIVCVLVGIGSANAGLLSGVTSTVGTTVGNLLGGTPATPTTPTTTKTGTGSAAAE